MEAISCHKDYLKLLTSAHYSQRRALIDTSTYSQIKLLCEIILNTITGTFDLDEATKQKLYKKKEALKTILKKSTPKRRKQLLLRKNLSTLEAILNLAIPYIEQWHTNQESTS